MTQIIHLEMHPPHSKFTKKSDKIGGGRGPSAFRPIRVNSTVGRHTTKTLDAVN